MMFVLALLILMSAYFSATETAFSTFNKIRMKNMAALWETVGMDIWEMSGFDSKQKKKEHV